MTVKTSPAKNSKAKNQPAKSKGQSSGIPITGDGKFPVVPVNSIEIVERPKTGEEHLKLYFNPRDISSFTPESMSQLRLSIRSDGLQTPPIVRATTSDKQVVKVELIAGERRLRSVQYIVEHDLPCFDEDCKRPQKYKVDQVVVCKGHFAKVVSHDEQVTVQILDDDNNLTNEQREFAVEDVYPTVPGSVLYAAIPCRVYYDISDARALRLAFAENDKAKSLSTREEIALVERLGRFGGGMKVAEIAELLGTNETWVSQTANFRTALPEEALEKLLDGSMKRHVAVNIMAYKPDDRKKAFEFAVEVESRESAAKIAEAEDEAAQAEDEEILALSDKKKAAKAGDMKGANKAARTASSAATKAEKARKKKERAEAEAGQIKTSHIQKGAAQAGLVPKKAKMLPKEEIEERYISALEGLLDGETTDPICGEEIPGDLVAMVRLTAMGIINGTLDPLCIIRQYMIEQQRWEPQTEDEDGDEDDEELDDDDFDPDDEEMSGPSDDDLDSLDDDDFDDDDDFAPVRGRGRYDDDDYDD